MIIQKQKSLETHNRILERGKKITQIRKASDTPGINALEIKKLKDAGRKY